MKGRRWGETNRTRVLYTNRRATGAWEQQKNAQHEQETERPKRKRSQTPGIGATAQPDGWARDPIPQQILVHCPTPNHEMHLWPSAGFQENTKGICMLMLESTPLEAHYRIRSCFHLEKYLHILVMIYKHAWPLVNTCWKAQPGLSGYTTQLNILITLYTNILQQT